MSACPHCSGTTGFTYRMRTEYIMSGSWGEAAEADQSPEGSKGMAECLDCRRKMRAETAEGTKGNQA